MNGFLCVLKPPGMTSSDVVVRVRRKLGRGVKVGHAGTLDPEASGVLPLMIGRAARLFDYLVEKEKTYVAQLKPGYATDTQDAHGAIIAGEGAHATRAQLEAVLPRFIGEIAQIPPMYSALKRGGQKLCDLARQGVEVQIEPRPTQVHAIDILHEQEDGSFILAIRCGRGTYIRTLCHDIGEKLGCGGCMESLLRTRVSSFTLKDSLKLPEIEKLQESGKIEQILMPVDAVFMQYPCVSILEEQEKILRNGNPFRVREIQNLLPEGQNVDELEKDRIRVYDTGGQFCAIYEYREEKGMFFPVKMFL